MPEPTTVPIGQVWADNDQRSNGRLIKIIRIKGEYALVVSSFDQFRWSVRETRIHLNRFNPTVTGYRLVSAENGGRHA